MKELREYIRLFLMCIIDCGFNLKESHNIAMLFYKEVPPWRDQVEIK